MKDTFIDMMKITIKMFVIPCKFNSIYPFIINLVDDIRNYHPLEKIVIVDSDSEDKSYFGELIKYDVIIEDVRNKNWMVGAYWHAFKKYPNEDFYFFMHDSMRVKSNLDYLKEKDLTTVMYFSRDIGNFNTWGNYITENSEYVYDNSGKGCYGPIFFCKNKVMSKMLERGADKFLPNNKAETGYCEGCYGFFLEDQGYNLTECSLFGDVLEIHSPGGKSGLPPHTTDWQYPIEKFYASYLDPKRL
jgi:hypothetical protein